MKNVISVADYGEEDNLETVQNLIKEIGNRFAAFESKIAEIKTKAAKELFDKPIDDILDYKE